MSARLVDYERIADQAMSLDTNRYLDRTYGAPVEMPEPDDGPDDTNQRLKECVDRCKAWIADAEIAAHNRQVEKVWQALEELDCDAAQMLEEKP